MHAQDILSRFNGSWALRPIKSQDGASVVGTDAILEQDILPAGLAGVPCLFLSCMQQHPPALCHPTVAISLRLPDCRNMGF